MHTFSVGLIIDSSNDNPNKIIEILNKNKSDNFHLEFIVIDVSLTFCNAIEDLLFPSSCHLIYKHHPAAKIFEIISTAVSISSSEWIIFGDLKTPFPEKIFERYYVFLHQNQDKSIVFLTCVNWFHNESSGRSASVPEYYDSCIPISQFDACLQRCYAGLFKRNLLNGLCVDFKFVDNLDNVISVLIAHYFLDYSDKIIGLPQALPEEKPYISDFLYSIKWSQTETYENILSQGYLYLLQKAASYGQDVPVWLQKTVLRDLICYFEIDMLERSPAAVVNENMACLFHDLIRKIIDYISFSTLEMFLSSSTNFEAIYALSTYKRHDSHSPVSVSAYDNDSSLICLRYYCHGQHPEEKIFLDNQLIGLAYVKTRACRFYRHELFGERILWFSTAGGSEFVIQLDGKSVPVLLKDKSDTLFSSNSFQHVVPLSSVCDVQSVFYPGMRGQKKIPFSFKGLKVRLFRCVSQIFSKFSFFKNVWIFLDRENEADDNAEHMYRWVRVNHPEHNIFFFLDRSSCHWERLKTEGFRLVSCGVLRKLLFLNSQCVVSSQAEYLYGGFNVELYGDLMRWRFVNLRHGVSQNDQSHWLNKLHIDLLIASCSAEYDAIVGDNTPYNFTTKEVCLTGMPRHDSLLALASKVPPSQIDTVLVMPTWRGSLVDGRGEYDGNIDKRIADSDYVKGWQDFLCSKELSDLMEFYHKQLVFMPHYNFLPYLEFLNLPGHIQILTKNETLIQHLFSRTAIMITDYSSVAFEIAYILRAVVYFQFDRENFFSGDHNWREGYFDYDRDGFGPIAKNREELIFSLKQILQNDSLLSDEYQEKMEKAFPFRDGQCSKRVYKNIIDLFTSNK